MVLSSVQDEVAAVRVLYCTTGRAERSVVQLLTLHHVTGWEMYTLHDLALCFPGWMFTVQVLQVLHDIS